MTVYPTATHCSRHLRWAELACWNRLGRPWGGCAAGELVATYPDEWRADRASRLAETFEAIRATLGGPIYINSAYRTSAYNRAVGGAKQSQHVFGRALDLRHPALPAVDVFTAIRAMQQRDELPHLGGLGRYKSFVHIDVRPKRDGRVAVWSGSGEGA